jgi:hypothetical protein
VSQQAETPAAVATAERPWYDRFTYTMTGTDQEKGWTTYQDRTALNIKLNPRWGVTVNVRDADRSRALAADEAAVGAYYRFTPRVRVGGAVSVAGAPRDNQVTAPNRTRSVRDQIDGGAGVKLESAFKF